MTGDPNEIPAWTDFLHVFLGSTHVRCKLNLRKALKHVWDCVARARREHHWGTFHKMCPFLYVGGLESASMNYVKPIHVFKQGLVSCRIRTWSQRLSDEVED